MQMSMTCKLVAEELMTMAVEPVDWPHTRVTSNFGPEWCCQECSLGTGDYVEWPCAATQLLALSIIGQDPKEI